MALNRSALALVKSFRLTAGKTSKRRKSGNLNSQYSILEPRQLLATISGQVLINEIMYHPSSQNDLEEFVELHNTSDVAVELGQWELQSAVRYTFPAATIGPGEYLVVAADLAAFQTRYPTVTNVIGGWSGRLSNHTEKVELVDAAGDTIDEVTYADEGDWSQRVIGPLDFGHRGWDWQSDHDGFGKSLELRQAALPNEFGSNWSSSVEDGGSPGVANGVAIADSAPLIADVSHFPIIPSSTDPVTISATVLDESDVGLTVSAQYRVDGTSTFSGVTLFDDGAHGDGAAGDGIFAAQVPAQSDSTVVEFFIEATDEATNTSVNPALMSAAVAAGARYLYQVDDSFDPSDPSGGSEFPTYRLIMTEAERAELAQLGSTSSESRSNAQMNGTFVSVNGTDIEARYLVGIRNRGAGSRNADPNNYRVNLPSDRPWQNIDQLNLNTQYTNSQLVGQTLFRLAGYQSEGGQAVSVLVNGEDLSLPGVPSYGQYIHIGAFDSNLVDDQFPGNAGGNLYQVQRGSGNQAGGDLRLFADPVDYEEFYNKRTNQSANDYSDLISLIDTLNNEPDETYLTAVEQIVDVDNWLAYFAINAILGTEETSLATGVGDDYFLYRGSSDTRFKLIPHDFDSILGPGDSDGSPTSGIYRAKDSPAVARFLEHETIGSQYHSKINDLLLGTFSKAKFDPVIRDLLEGFTPTEVVDDMIEFMDVRREFLLGLVDAPLTASSELPIVGGYHRTSQDVAAIFGTAALAETQSVLVNGQPANLDPVTGIWTLGVPSGVVSETLVAEESQWQYLDAGNVPSTAVGNDWRVDNPGWTDSGNARLGYGDSEDQTVVEFIDTDPDDEGTQKNITTYFRKEFNVTDANRFTDLTLRLLRDDGALVFLNGEEIVRSNLPDGPITSTTTAESTVSGGNEDTFFPFTIDPADLIDGINVLAVEIHQINDSSSDISFDLELVATEAGTSPATGLLLLPGINRVIAQSFSGIDGTGQLLDSAHVDVWYDDGVTQPIGGTIDVDTTLTLANSPYVVTDDLVIQGDATLTIEPGVTVFFEGGTGLEVTGTGQVIAEGTEFQRIQFTYNPSTSSSWEGIRVIDTQTDNRFSYIDFVAGADQGEALFVESGRATFDNVSWSGSERQVIDLVHPNLIVSNSVIPGISGGETIHMNGYEPGDYLEFNGNVIGVNTSGGDVVDVAHNSLTPPPIYFRNNVFLGGFDDGIDTDGNHVIIENNVFQNFHDNTSRTTTSNAVSTGFATIDGQRISSRLELRNNIFFDNDHHLLLKDFSSAILINNTLAEATVAAISLAEPNGSAVVGPGSSITLDGNIVVGFPEFFESRMAETEVVINRSIVPIDLHSAGVGNIDADPLFVDSFNRDYRLKLGSPALSTGPDGTNIGAVQNQPASLDNLFITEINYHPHDPQITVEQAFDADEFEFIELMNTHPDSALDLQGVQIAGGVSYTFGNVVLAPGERVVVVESVDAFETRYGTDVNVAGTWSGGLSNSGEELVLLDRDGIEVSSVDYGDSDPWPVAADGAGATLVLIDPLNTPAAEVGKHYHWRSSVAQGGTPAIADAAPAGIVINEVLAHSDGLETDAIELFNRTNSNVDIGGWYLSDSKSNLFKFRIPLETTLAAGEFIVFSESDFNPMPSAPGPDDFALNGSEGEEVYLTRPDENGNPEFIDAVGFGGSFDGQTIGRVPDGTGRLTPLSANTLGDFNSDPDFGPIVISEVHYHPTDPTVEELEIEPALTASDFEFVEIHNPTSAAVDLTNWRLRGEADFDFATGATLESGQTLIIVSFDPEDLANDNRLTVFINRFGLSPGMVYTQLVGGYSGRLNNSFGRVELQQPDAAPVDDPTLIPHVTADEVLYDDLTPWPVAADGTGSSLNRTATTAYGNAASSWEAATPTPGLVSIVSASVEGRHVFYNNSSFDGNDPDANASDDLAISGKGALLPGLPATFAHYTSYSKGINGLFIDIADLGSTQLVSSDFGFATGNSSVASDYQPLGIDPAITVRAGAGVNGSDRVTLIFPDGSVTQTWLQVTVKANAATGLAIDDVFYFGNVIGETGNSDDAAVNLSDVSLARTNQSGFGSVGIDSIYDFDRNGRVNLADLSLARTNQSGFSAVQLITAPGGGSTSKTFFASSQFALANAKTSTEILSSVAAVPTLRIKLPTVEEAQEIASISEIVATVEITEPAERDVVFSLPNFFELSDFETLDEEELAFNDVIQQRWAMYDHLRN